MLRKGENQILFPESHPRTDISPLAHLKCQPGEYIAVMDPPREKTAGGVHLLARGDGWSDPHGGLSAQAAEEKFNKLFAEWQEASAQLNKDKMSFKLRAKAAMLCDTAMTAYHEMLACQEQQNPGAALDLRPDSYTIAAVGKDVPFIPGDRVLIAPYAAWRFKSLLGVPDVVHVGLDDPWDEITIMIFNPTIGNRCWEPLSNWLVLQLEVQSVNLETLKKRYKNCGRVVLRGPNAESQVGQMVALHKDRTVQRPDDTKWFVPRLSHWGEGVVFVREWDSVGTRRILGTIMNVKS